MNKIKIPEILQGFLLGAILGIILVIIA